MDMAERTKKRISEMCSHFIFEYQGKPCGIDPISKENFDMWYGDSYYNATSIDEVMNYPLFNNKSLTAIAQDIDIIDW